MLRVSALGGGGVGAQQCAEAWAAKGHRVTVLTSGASGLAGTEVINGVRVIRVLAFGRRNRATATLLAMLAYNLMGAIHLLLRRRDFAQLEVINGHFSIPTGPLAALAARLLQRPNVLTIIGGGLYDPSKRSSPHRNPLLRRVNRWLINDADRVIAIPSDTKRRAEQWYGTARPIEIVNYGFRPSGAEGQAPAPRDAGGFRLISVGRRLVERKGFAYLVEALTMLPDSVGLVAAPRLVFDCSRLLASVRQGGQDPDQVGPLRPSPNRCEAMVTVPPNSGIGSVALLLSHQGPRIGIDFGAGRLVYAQLRRLGRGERMPRGLTACAGT